MIDIIEIAGEDSDIIITVDRIDGFRYDRRGWHSRGWDEYSESMKNQMYYYVTVNGQHHRIDRHKFEELLAVYKEYHTNEPFTRDGRPLRMIDTV